MSQKTCLMKFLISINASGCRGGRVFMTDFSRLLFIFLALVAFTACNGIENRVSLAIHPISDYTWSSPPNSKKPNSKKGVVYASQFLLGRSDSLSTIQVIQPTKNLGDTLTYLLYPRHQKPSLVTGIDTTLVPVPLQRMVIFSTTHAAMLAELDAADAVIGMGESEWVVNQSFRSRLENGKITPLPGAGNLAMEQIIDLEPDAVMMIGQFANKYTRMKKLRNLGIPVFINADWLEQTPLGRAEWIKVMGRLVGKKAQADRYFNQLAKEYNSLNALTTPLTLDNRPTVLMNLSFKDQWYVPGGNSYMAALLQDAGADYPWKQTAETGGIPMSFEEVYQVGLKADIWLNPGAASTQYEILETDKRLKKFKPFAKGTIYNITKWRGEGGGYAFWERGVVHPEEILADLTKILHPELLPNHEFIYYEKLN